MVLGSGIRKKPIPDPGSRIRIRNTANYLLKVINNLQDDESLRSQEKQWKVLIFLLVD
jgi:hypothetical protein